MINKSIKYIGVILLAYTLNACNEQRMNSSSETTTPVWLAEVGKRDVRELTTTTGTAKAAKTVEVKSETNGKYELMINPKTKRPYKLGDIVEEGAVIIKLKNTKIPYRCRQKRCRSISPRKSGKAKKPYLKKAEPRKKMY